MKRTGRDQLVVELDGVLYALRRRRASRPRSIDDIRGDKWYLTDFRETEPRFITVESPAKYADLIVQRRLTDAGELGTETRILSHRKTAKDKNTTEVFFTAAPADSVTEALDRAAEDRSQHLVFSIHALLPVVLRRFAPHKTAAVLFEHGRHVDILVGRKGRPAAASRVSSYSEDSEAKRALIDASGNELRALVDGHRLHLDEIVYFSWAVVKDGGGLSPSTAFGSDGTRASTTTMTHGATTAWGLGTGQADHRLETLAGSEWVRQLARDLDVGCQVLPIERFDLDEGETLLTSVTTAANHLPHSDSCSPPANRMGYVAQRLAPLSAAAVWLLVAGLFGVMLVSAGKTESARTQIAQLADAGLAVRDTTVKPLEESQVEVVRFARALDQVRSAPSIEDILVDVSYAHAPGMAFDRVRVEYDEEARPTVVLEGRIPSGFQQASAAHKQFLGALEGLGYKVVDSHFTTDVEQLAFALTLQRTEQ